MSTRINDQISEEAAQWLVEFRSGDIDPAGRRDFAAWLRASPEHIRAFIEMAALWHEGGAIDPRRQLDVEEIIARAQHEQNIVGPVGLTPPSRTLAHTAADDARNSRAAAAWWAVAASFVVAALAAALILGSRHTSPPPYTTGVRALRSIALPDGSKALLDSKSELRVSYTAAERTVELIQGQALFDVVKNPERPFVVLAGHALVRDVGTVFDVNRLGDGTIITVVEGRVAARESGSAQPMYLSAGEQFSVGMGQFSPEPVRVDISSEIAWTHGQVVLDSATLPEVAQVFDRYSTRRLVARDVGEKPLRLSGVFSTSPDFLIQYLRGRADITVTETDSEIDIVRSPGAAR